MTLSIFHSLNFIKMMPPYEPLPEDLKIEFEFKKPFFSKLIIFDLDETLIHSKRDEEELENN